MTDERLNPHQALWRALSGAGDRGASDRTARAALRRLDTLSGEQGDEIDLFTPLQAAPFNAYRRQLKIGHEEHLRLRYAAVAACAIAWVEDDVPNAQLGKLLGAAEGSDQPRLAETRFTRLLRCDTPERLLREVRRLVRILDRGAPVEDLGATLVNWTSPYGLRSRRRWAFDYWNMRDAAPIARFDTTTQ